MNANKPQRGKKPIPNAHQSSAFFQPNARQLAHHDHGEFDKEGTQEHERIQAKSDTFGSTPFFSPQNTIQAKLKIGAPGDMYEKEADTVADKVVQGGSADSRVAPERAGIQQQVGGSTKEETIQNMEQEVPTQAQNPDGALPAGATLENNLNGSKGKGQKLDEDTKNEMETGIGSDFSNVNVHTDAQAVQMNQDLGADAFTHGNDIYFNRGQYNPTTKKGKHLLAHELTHTVQQGGAVQRKKAQTNISSTSHNVQGGFWGRVWGGIKSFGQSVWSGTKKFASWAWNGAKSIGSSVWNWLKNAGTQVWKAIKWFGNKAWDLIKALGTVLWEKLVWLGINAWSFISNLPKRFWRLMVHGWEGIKGTVSWLWKGLKGGAKHIWKAVTGTFSWLKDGIFGALRWIGDGLDKGFAWAVDFVKNPSLSKLWDGLLGGLSWLGEGVKGFVRWGWRGIQGAAVWAREGLSGLAGWIWDGIVGAGKWLAKDLLLLLEFFGLGERLQIIWGLIFRMRKLTPAEIAASLKVHPSGMIPYNLIRVDENSLISSLGGDSAVTTMHIIHSPKGGISKSTMVHELTHVAQYEHVGAVYMAEAVHAQQVYGRTGGGVGSGDAYDYTRDGALPAQRAAGRKFKDLNREAQAQLVQDYYDGLMASFSILPKADYDPFIQDMQNGEF